MELHSSLVFGKPVIVPLVGTVVVQDHMNLFVRRQIGYDRIQETAEVLALLQFCRLSMDVSAGDLQGGKEI